VESHVGPAPDNPAHAANILIDEAGKIVAVEISSTDLKKELKQNFL
jgi:hypothetical protein